MQNIQICKCAKEAKYAEYAKYAKPNLVNYDLPNQTKTFRNKPHQSLLVKITVKTWMISPLLILNWIPNQMLMHMFENMESQTYQAKPAKPNLT